MAKSEKKSGLGRGLGSLLPGTYDAAAPAQPHPARERVAVKGEEEAALEAPVSTRPARIPTEGGESVSEPVIREVGGISRVVEGMVSDRLIDEVAINLIAPNPDQPRKQFKKEEIEELAASIQKNGLLQPILVRQIENGTYQIIAGERRWQASRAAGLASVPVRVRNTDDDEALELALIENIQRSDLNPIEEAYGYRCLMERRGMTQAEVAQAVSKGRSTIANALRLLDLPEEAQQLLFEEKITAGHARAILSVPTQEGRATLTAKITDGNLTVREAENLARLLSGKKDAPTAKRPAAPAVYKTVAKTLKEVLNTNVKIKSSKGKNKIEIEFSDEEDLQRLFNEIVGESDES